MNRLGFDARAAFLDPNRGFGRVARSLAEALLQQAPDEVVVFVSSGAPLPPSWRQAGARVIELSRPRRGAFLSDPLAWRWTAGRQQLGVLHLPAWGVPPGLSFPVVATFHDATPLRFGSPPSRWQRHRLIRGIRSLRRATLIHAVSEHARGELLEFVEVSADRVHVVHHGVGPPFSPLPEPAPARHLLYVGGSDPHKNLGTLLEAMRLPGAEALPPLLLVGPRDEEVLARSRLANERVSCLPACTDDELVAAYHEALAVLLPSRNEGFGLPALEAMACGCPVLAARTGALPEVCGDAAALLHPDEPKAWLDAALGLQGNPDRRAAMITAGLAHARTKSWQRAAGELLGLYREAMRCCNARR